MLELKDTRYNEIRIRFKEENHSYTDTIGNTYKSTTTLLHDYCPKFEKDYWLKRKAKELGISEKRLAEQWNTITKEACERGTKTHNELEDSIKSISMLKDALKYMTLPNGEMITVADIPNININIKELDINEFKDATENKYPEIYNVLGWYVARGYHIYAEIGAFLIDYLISGTIDVLLIRDDKHVIGDWKTNRGGLIFESGYYKKDKSTKPAQETNLWVPTDTRLLAPCSHMPDCNGSVYNLQVSMYAYMVETILGVPNAGIWLCHIDSDFELNQYGQPKRFPDGLYHIKENPKERTTFHKLPYLKKEIEMILADRLKVVNAQGVKQQFDLGL